MWSKKKSDTTQTAEPEPKNWETNQPPKPAPPSWEGTTKTSKDATGPAGATADRDRSRLEDLDIEANKNYVDGGEFQPDKYQKASS